MIDIHIHLLPGIDDGPATMEETLALARLLVQEGIRIAIATPHYNDQYPRLSAIEVRKRVDEVQQVLNGQGIPLHVYAGHEVLIKPDLFRDIEVGRVATLNGSRYLLLELWMSAWIPETERVLFELLMAGIVPILAHPERYRTFQQNPERLAALQRQGVLAQLTANSLVGFWGKTVQRCAETLLKNKLINFIASDAHGVHKRPPKMKESLQRAEQLLGQSDLQQMIERRPMAVLCNQAVF